MVWKIVCSAIGVFAVIAVATMAPDLKRYIRIKTM
ncbi:MAG: DUF6893 family small protein [Acidobacteriaceae bacterium]